MKKIFYSFSFIMFSLSINAQFTDSEALRICNEELPRKYSNNGTLCGKTFTSDKTGWNRSDFEWALNLFRDRYGWPTDQKTNDGSNMFWVWRSRNYYLVLNYQMQNSLAPAETIIFVMKSK
ncbi:MAG: hypothetical protein Q4C75_02090 [Bergeyella zoohelcum]|nr:hypothetical protein [Bergeyella zoohelcum]